MKLRRYIFAGICQLLLGSSALAFLDNKALAESQPGSRYLARTLPFVVRANGLDIGYEVAPLFVLPGENVTLEATSDGQEQIPIKCETTGGVITAPSPFRCSWEAPLATGHYSIAVAGASASLTLNTFVMLPMSALRDGKLNGYQIGSYSTPHMGSVKRAETYQLPRGFIEVTAETQDILLSPHFALGQFACKSGSGYPKYVVLREPLLFKLERILEEVNRLGIRADTFQVMSGYRTPHYNQAIENVKFSRHVFGDAADIFVPHADEVQYRLEGLKETRTIFNIVDRLEQLTSFRRFIGGMGQYRATANHPPFVHVDVRGFPARW